MTTTEVRDKLRQAGYSGTITINMEAWVGYDNSLSETWDLGIEDHFARGPDLTFCLLKTLEALKNKPDNK